MMDETRNYTEDASHYYYKFLKWDDDDGAKIALNKFLIYETTEVDDMIIKSDLKEIKITSRMIKCLQTQREKLVKTLKKLKGGKCRKKTIEDWKSWKNNYVMKFRADEVPKQFIYRHYKNYTTRQIALDCGSEKIMSFAFNEQANEIKQPKSGGRSFSDLSASQQNRVRKKIEDTMISSVKPLCNVYGVESSVVMDKSNLVSKVSIGPSDSLPLANQDDSIKATCLVKDKFRISDQAYKELSAITPSLPRFYQISKVQKDINDELEVFNVPGSAEGVQISFVKDLHKRLSNLLSKNYELSDHIKLKFSGDGTWIGKRLHVVNFTYTILNEGRRAMSEMGNYCLAIVKVKEDHESLRESLSGIVKEMEETKEIEIDGKKFRLEYFLGGDWKFLACVCGIGAANSSHACIWCTCDKTERGDKSRKWSMLDPELGARSVKGIEAASVKKGKQFSVKYSPLFKFIPLHNVVIDNLHLFLRISDVLIARLIHDLKVLDSMEKKKTFPKGFDRKLCSHLAAYEKFLKDDLKINFEVRVGKDSKKLEYRDLTGPEKNKLFEHIDLSILIPPNTKLPYDGKEIQKIWNLFYNIIYKLKADSFSEVEISILRNDIESWFHLFLDTYLTLDCTPYIHAFVYHVVEFIELHGNLNFFNQQGLEKFNDVCTKIFFRATNMRACEALKQVLEKRNRTQTLEDQGYERVSRNIHCHNCNMTDHTILKCMAPCSNCSDIICSRHLLKVKGIYYRKCLLPRMNDEDIQFSVN